jgi:hypothetical protein
MPAIFLLFLTEIMRFTIHAVDHSMTFALRQRITAAMSRQMTKITIPVEEK